MKEIVGIIKKERLWGPILWVLLLVCILLVGNN